MDENRIEGTARNLGGKAQDASQAFAAARGDDEYTEPPRTAVLCKARWSNRGLRAAARAAERTDEDHLCVSRAAQIWVPLEH